MTEIDEGPEWGYCEAEGCNEPAEPLWFTDGPPNDPSLILCYKHTGERVGDALILARAALSETLTRMNNYDWNADPESITLMQGDAFAALDLVLVNHIVRDNSHVSGVITTS